MRRATEFHGRARKGRRSAAMMDRLAANTEAQKARRRAAMGTSLRHSGHVFVAGTGDASPRRMRASSLLIGITTKQ